MAGGNPGLDRPGDVMPTMEMIERRRRARAVGLPLDTPIEIIALREQQLQPAPGFVPTYTTGNSQATITRAEIETSPVYELPEPDQHGERYFRIELPWLVVVPDNRKHGVIEGRILLSKRYRRAKEKAHEIALASCMGRRFAEGCVEMQLTVYPPDDRRRDISNVQKLIGDALQEAAYTNDQQIVRWVIERKQIDRDNSRIVVMVSAHPCP